jgi:alkylation response protein AidB-like acyl-CoA dehydrogenase
MDFALTEEQRAVVELAEQIFTDKCAPEVLRQVESGADWFHRDLWDALAAAGLLGIPLPESVGGGGFGVVEACLLLREAGRAVAPVPIWSTLTAAMTVAERGTDEQRSTWLPGVVDGSTALAVALDEPASDPRDPQVTAARDGDRWVLRGTKTNAPAVHLASAVLVPARLDGASADGATDDVAVFVVPTDDAGLVALRQDTFNHEPHFQIDLGDVVVGDEARLPGGRSTLDRLVDLATVGLCALASGVADGGTIRTAVYVSERKQFDRPIGSFQAVGHRMADCYIDNEAIRLTMLQAATRLAAGEPADREVAVAKYWASYGGRRVGHADLHLHGGISIDLDYPIHRYFLWAKQLELQLGAAGPQLARLGRLIAAG